MNYGTYAGPGTGVPVGTISRYIQTPDLYTSQTIAVPPGTQRIEALLVGGGGAGGGNNGGGGGFGGAAIIEIPITGASLQVVIGAGGTGAGGRGPSGSPTYIVSAGTRYAEVGGGGGGTSNNYATSGGSAARSGGGGGGVWNSTTSWYSNGGVTGVGGAPPIGKLLWTAYPQESQAVFLNDVGPLTFIGPSGAGAPASVAWNTPVSSNYFVPGGNGSFGGGGGCGAGLLGGYGAGGSSFGGGSPTRNTAGNWGGGGAASDVTGTGGSLASVSVWGFTGGAGGTTVGLGGGGGGGMFGAGAAVIRFYL